MFFTPRDHLDTHPLLILSVNTKFPISTPLQVILSAVLLLVMVKLVHCSDQIATMTGNMTKLQKLQMDSIDAPYYFKTNNMNSLDIRKVSFKSFVCTVVYNYVDN